MSTSTSDADSEQVALDLRDLYENAPCGYHSVGPDGTVLRMNRTELTWLGFTRNEVVGTKRFADLLSPGERARHKCAIGSVIAGGQFSEIETEMVRKDGATFDALLRIVAVRDSQGTFLHTRATLIDITTRKRAETEARIHAQQLQVISQRVVEIQEAERRNLSAELHDRLGQDLAAINLNLHIIKEQLSDGLRAKVGPRLDDSIALVERTVEVARDVAGALRPLVLDDYGLAVALKSYGEQFSARTGIRVIVETKHAFPRLRQEAEMALFRVSQEALTNVLKHAKASVVRIAVAVDAECVALTIADDGRGFDSPAPMDRELPGLGLLIMRERLRAVKGTLRVESRAEGGTRMVARIRRAP
jgi:PAS domain S-box-containing protein